MNLRRSRSHSSIVRPWFPVQAAERRWIYDQHERVVKGASEPGGFSKKAWGQTVGPLQSIVRTGAVEASTQSCLSTWSSLRFDIAKIEEPLSRRWRYSHRSETERSDFPGIAGTPYE